MPRAVAAEPAGGLACRGEAPHPILGPFLVLILGCCSPACLDTQTSALCSSQDSLGGSIYVWPGLAWPGYCARRGEEEGHPLPLMCLPSQSCVPPASLGTAALPEHPSPGPGLPLNLPQETSSRCWRTGCSSGSLRAPGGQDRGRFGWSEVKTTSIALARTLCNPLDKLGEARERGRTLDQEWEEVEVGVSGLEEAERDNIWPRTLIIRESISTILISLSCQRSQSP